MKKISIFIAIVILLVGLIAYMYLNYKVNYNMAKKSRKFDRHISTIGIK